MNPQVEHTFININNISIIQTSIWTYICRLFMVVIIIGFILQFCIFDLYFAYNSQSCQSNNDTSFPFTLGTWLKVDGYNFIISYIILIIVNIIFNKEREKAYVLIKIFTNIVSYFIIAWTVIGCIMFWKYIEPTETCDSNISYYMYSRLILGIISGATFLLKKIILFFYISLNF